MPLPCGQSSRRSRYPIAPGGAHSTVKEAMPFHSSGILPSQSFWLGGGSGCCFFHLCQFDLQVRSQNRASFRSLGCSLRPQYSQRRSCMRSNLARFLDGKILFEISQKGREVRPDQIFQRSQPNGCIGCRKGPCIGRCDGLRKRPPEGRSKGFSRDGLADIFTHGTPMCILDGSRYLTTAHRTLIEGPKPENARPLLRPLRRPLPRRLRRPIVRPMQRLLQRTARDLCQLKTTTFAATFVKFFEIA